MCKKYMLDVKNLHNIKNNQRMLLSLLEVPCVPPSEPIPFLPYSVMIILNSVFGVSCFSL